MFDPYHRWLGIPRHLRPPTYYQLLGIAVDETDAEVIAEAALRQTSHVRTYQAGPHAALCTALLNEIAQAKRTLLNPARRSEYDAGLARAAAAQEAPPPLPEPDTAFPLSMTEEGGSTFHFEEQQVSVEPVMEVNVEPVVVGPPGRPGRARVLLDRRDCLFMFLGAMGALAAQGVGWLLAWLLRGE